MSENDPALLDGAIPPPANTKLFGHAQAEAFLADSYRSGKGHHAVLIEGPEGIGKATLAFRFAAHVLANENPLAAPDHLADPDPDSIIGRQMASGASHNVLHIERPVDEKSGRLKSAITVDEVRRLGKFFGQTSGSGNWRIAIIDPADDMNRNAANALLKILEEPPKKSLLLLLTHSPGKLLPTIRSRCMRLRLEPLGAADMENALAHLGVAVPAKDRETVLSMAGGSVGEALKLVNYGGLDIVAAFRDILATEGPQRRRKMHKLADVLAAKDADIIHAFFIGHVTEELMHMARGAAMAGNLPEADRLSRLSTQVAERIAISQGYNLDKKQTIISILEAFG
ncbi:DNA polymerase III subunit delta' [Gellertiella hungarica]|uniref:DNA polymerase-3 subunit delta n=1 Tax=Gellertiella hungarica TaxID=1572859 RepID=A0A7W6J4R1_9HYPH|nr:DNA polymerase III subunit delta' [Gellertiella hungarica]MBB4064769.1 DNA polymerase-3 subunit delta' [Gellertiella hungarica]